MKRDWEIIREILVTVEKSANLERVNEGCFEESRLPEISYNVNLLLEGDFLKGAMIETLDAQDYYYFDIARLTFKGHELLDSIRNDTVWNKVKNKLGNLLTEVPIEIVKNMGAQYLTELVLN